MKRVLSLLLAVVIMLSVFAGVEINAQAATSGEQVVAYARQYVGYNYVSGGSSPETGFDCSGFTMYVYGHFGVSLPHSSSMIYNNPENYGTLIASNDYSKALPGDLICWMGHVGIYSGIYEYSGTYRGFLVDAANVKRGVVEQPIRASNGDYKVIRIKGIGNPVSQGEMATPTITLDSTSYSVGSYAEIVWAPTSANSDFKNYTLEIKNNKTDGLLYSGSVGTQGNPYNTDYSLKCTVPGTYTITITAIPYNDAASRSKKASAQITIGTAISSIDDYKTSTGYNLNGWVYDSNGKVYCFGSGKARIGWYSYEGSWYCFGSNGVMRTGWYFYKDNWYYFGVGAMVTGWAKVSGIWYYFNANGEMQTGWQKIGGTWYYFNESGAMLTGWAEINGVSYYFDESGAMATGWKQIENEWFYFNSSGARQTGWQYIGNKWYYFNAFGVMKTGWLSFGGKWYYMNPASGAMANGWAKISDVWYYFANGGVMQTGWQDIKNARYYFAESGAMQTGWLKLDDVWYYLNESGAMAIGWLNLSGKWYYLNESGAMQTGWLELNGSRYYLNDYGLMATGWKSVDGNWYYFNNSGSMKIGWLKYKNNWYYFDLNSGIMLANTSQSINGKDYSFDANGVCTNP